MGVLLLIWPRSVDLFHQAHGAVVVFVHEDGDVVGTAGGGYDNGVFGDSSEEMKSIVLVSLDENATSFKDGNVFFEGKGPTPFKVTPVIYDAANDMILEKLEGTLGTTEDETVEDSDYW